MITENFKGQGYCGSNGVKTTSTANTEIVPVPTGWTGRCKIYKMIFTPLSNCTVKINGSDPIYMVANETFETDINDEAIESFIIIEVGAQYRFIGAYL